MRVLPSLQRCPRAPLLPPLQRSCARPCAWRKSASSGATTPFLTAVYACNCRKARYGRTTSRRRCGCINTPTADWPCCTARASSPAIPAKEFRSKPSLHARRVTRFDAAAPQSLWICEQRKQALLTSSTSQQQQQRKRTIDVLQKQDKSVCYRQRSVFTANGSGLDTSLDAADPLRVRGSGPRGGV